jgi:4-carboxymuconolactone decarboxylase
VEINVSGDELDGSASAGERGRALMTKMIGADTVQRITERNAIAPMWQRWTTEVLFGEVWSGDGLALRDRSMITVAVLVTMSRPVELENHMRAALVNGVTADELAEIVQHVGFYTGWPAVGAALTILKRIVDESS